MQNTELSGDIRNLAEGHRLLSEQVQRLSKTQYKLANYINELKYGGKKELLISELKANKKSVIIGVYTSFVNENKKLATKTSKDFTAALYKAFGTNTPEKRDDSDFDKLLSDGERELLYKLLQSWLFLATNDLVNKKSLTTFLSAKFVNKSFLIKFVHLLIIRALRIISTGMLNRKLSTKMISTSLMM